MKNLLIAFLIFFPFSLVAQEGWSSVFIEADSSGKPFEILDTVYVPLYPDSNIVNGTESYKGFPLEKQHHIHGIGQSYEFVAHDWISFENDRRFVDGLFDSIIIKYHYYRTSSSDVIDTLIVQLSNTEYNKDSSAAVATKNNLLSKEQFQTVKMPLTEADSCLLNNNPKYMILTMDEPFYGQKAAVTITFKNGTVNDTLIGKDTLNSANIFSLGSYAAKKSEKPPMRFNNGLLLTTDGKYLDSTYSRSFLELHGDTVELYPIVYFNFYLWGGKNIDDKFIKDVNVYPTTINSGEKITIIANGFENASIFDLNGKLMLDSSTNQISTRGLAKGVYLLKITHANRTVSKRIMVY
ncbi:MAG: T9SS type A sorting domain-containing protein [Bacteroidia bacterium]